MSDVRLFIPEEHLVGNWTIDEMRSVPHKTKLFLLHTREQVRLCRPMGGEIDAWSYAFHKADDENYRAWMILSVEDLWPGLIAHEATHVILGWEANAPKGWPPQARWARWWLNHHPERVAEGVGNLTQVIVNTVWEYMHKPGESE